MRNFARYNRAVIKRYEQWMFAMHYAKPTKVIYARSLRRFVAFLGEKSVATVGHIDIQRYLSHISENGASLNGAYRDLGVLRLFYDFLHLGGVVNYVAPRYVRLRRPWWNSPSPLTELQVQRLISAARTPRELALIEVFYGTGCRLSEVRRLKIEEIDLNSRCARVCGKLGKVRTVLLTKSAERALRDYIAGRKQGYVFQPDWPAANGCLHIQDEQWKLKWPVYDGANHLRRLRTKCLGTVTKLSHEEAKRRQEAFIADHLLKRPTRTTALTQVCIRELIKKMGDRVGLKRVTPHTLRRTFASHLYDNGAAIDVIKVLMGHVWIQTTMKYARMSRPRLAKIFDERHPRERLALETN
jgi:site-specific recombinase XerD